MWHDFTKKLIPQTPILTKEDMELYKRYLKDINYIIYNGNITEEDYIRIRLNEFKEFQRILKDKGVILYNISYNNANAVLPLMLMVEVHKQTDLTVVDMISWSKKTNIPFQTSPRLLGRKVEQIYVIVKKDELHTFRTNK